MQVFQESLEGLSQNLAEVQDLVASKSQVDDVKTEQLQQELNQSKVIIY